MAKLYITTQTYENYGDAEVPHWKPKGGSDYFVPGVDVNSAAATVDKIRPQFECSNAYFVEHVLGWEIVADDYMTEFEQSQLDYEGVIRYPARVLTLV